MFWFERGIEKKVGLPVVTKHAIWELLKFMIGLFPDEKSDYLSNLLKKL